MTQESDQSKQLVPERQQKIDHIRQVCEEVRGLSFESEDCRGDFYSVRLASTGDLYFSRYAGDEVLVKETLDTLHDEELEKFLATCYAVGKAWTPNNLS